MLSVIAFILPFVAQTAVGAISPLQQVPFFKSTESLFPSGATSLEALEKQQLQKNVYSDYVYRWNKQSFKKGEIKPLLPVHLSEFVVDIATQKRWRVTDIGVDALKVENAITKAEKKFSTNEVVSDSYDLGFALILKDAYLKSAADERAPVLTTIPQGYRLRPLFYQGGFFKVQYKTYTGFVSLAEALTKFDLCTMAFSEGQWHFIKRRDFDQLITNDQQKISLNKVQKLITPDTRGIIASSSQKIPLWSQVEVLKSSQPDWTQSFLKGHGPIWWKRPSENGDQFSENEEVLTDDLIRRPIASVSFDSKNPLKGLVSSNGIYMTEDGLHWKKFKQFENMNGPVHYFNDSLIFVGNYRSTDGGKTFENYIQIDKLAQAIQDHYGFLPRRLQVSKIETKAPYRVQIEIETGYRKITMESPLFSQNWKAAKL